MATPNYSEEEIQFRKRARRRLVGAVVLVALVVAVVPLILPESKPQQDTQQIDIRIPTQDATGFTPKITPATIKAPASASAAVETDTPPALIKAPTENLPPDSEASPGSVTAPKPAMAKPPVSADTTQEAPNASASAEPLIKVAGTKAQTFYLQYGAFSELKNAKQRQAELKAKGVPTFTEVVKTTAGDKIRVRAGPYTTRDKAEQVREKTKPLEGKLVVIGQ